MSADFVEKRRGFERQIEAAVACPIAEWSREAVSPSGLGRRSDLERQHGNKLGELSKVLAGSCEQERGPRTAPVYCAAGSHGDTNLGVTSVAAPQAASSRVARYSRTEREAVSGSRCLFQSEPGMALAIGIGFDEAGVDRDPSPPTWPSAMHRSTTVSKRCRKESLSLKRLWRFFEKVE
jgi:hypothetical protein